PGDRHGTIPVQPLAEGFEHVRHLAPLDGAIARPYLHRMAARRPYALGLAAEETVPPPFLAALHALEQEAVATPMDLQERRYRRLEIAEDLATDRHDVASPRQRDEVCEARPDRSGDDAHRSLPSETRNAFG